MAISSDNRTPAEILSIAEGNAASASKDVGQGDGWYRWLGHRGSLSGCTQGSL